jgi:uncharacterized protein YcbK (DUF882 family)
MKHFKEEEFKQGHLIVFDKMEHKLLNDLDSLRELCGFGLKINSSYRSKEHNESIGGAKNSYHLKGMAVDLHCTDAIKRKYIVKNALNLGLSVGVAKTFIHVDTRDIQILFTY